MTRSASSPSTLRGALVRLALVFAALVLPGAGHAQVEIAIDNDLLGLRGADDPPPDYEYTHGLSVSWDAARSEIDASRGVRWEVGQRIYTPRRDAAEPIPGERPYAGWLYGAWERMTTSARSRARLRVEAGVTGPPSLAEPVQNAFHRLAGYQAQLGWKHQLGFEPGIIVSYGRESRVLAIGGGGAARVEVLPSWAVRAGNVRTGAEAGVRARLGWGAGDAWTGAGAARGVSGWVEAGARQEAVLRDLFIDGNTFAARDSGLNRRTWVAQGEAAFGIRYRRTELEYRFVLRGREYETQTKPHPYGSVRVRIHR
ncbi:lipid A deacylase LpxR family protein [Longimicrobium sp.]|uniref:lipid A deacylase LpxR family protein n=1 Tax=Longimicrobium sp. TaxID=2029185 RepID=UPI003B3B8C71